VERARRGDEHVLVVDVAGLVFLDAFGLHALEGAATGVTGDAGRLVLRGATGAVALLLRLCSFDPGLAAKGGPRPLPIPMAPGRAHRRRVTVPNARVAVAPMTANMER